MRSSLLIRKSWSLSNSQNCSAHNLGTSEGCIFHWSQCHQSACEEACCRCAQHQVFWQKLQHCKLQIHQVIWRQTQVKHALGFYLAVYDIEVLVAKVFEDFIDVLFLIKQGECVQQVTSATCNQIVSVQSPGLGMLCTLNAPMQPSWQRNTAPKLLQ